MNTQWPSSYMWIVSSELWNHIGLDAEKQATDVAEFSRLDLQSYLTIFPKIISIYI